MLTIFSIAQQKTVTVIVTGIKDKSPLAGVTVQTKNKTVLTDASGNFSIAGSAGNNIT